MKKIFATLTALCILAACSSDNKANEQITAAIKSQLKKATVTIADGVEANTNGFSGSKKEISVDYGDATTSSKSLVLNTAYHCADTAYQVMTRNKEKLPDFFQIKVKAGGMTSDNYNFKSAYLANDAKIVDEIKIFMNAVVQKRFNDLAGYMEPGVDLSQIVNLLKNADAGGDGVTQFQVVALQHAKGVHKPDNKPMEVIQGWVLIKGKASNKEYPMLFVINPANSQLSSVYINPGKQS